MRLIPPYKVYDRKAAFPLVGHRSPPLGPLTSLCPYSADVWHCNVHPPLAESEIVVGSHCKQNKGYEYGISSFRYPIRFVASTLRDP
ncbi:unnamed protein product, partial [Iphiclides podalirius]